MTLESLPKAALAEHLTDALRRSGVLGDARVCDVAVASSRPTLLSQVTRLRLTYDSAAPDAPATVILKTGLPERAGDRWNAGRQEVAFYTQVASAMSARLVPRCFEAQCDADTNAHVWNSFLPADGNGDDVRLFDWDSWRIDVGTDDLAYMMALHWYPDHRRRFERPLLDRYHATLVEHGVRGYDRGALDDDYRWSALWHITTPVWQASINIPPVIWWNNLERILLAVDDLGCRDLLV